jgi:CHASE2 domain-containing sensor protein/tRNA A-37 threonylcarbamoyl transferase component Bud32
MSFTGRFLFDEQAREKRRWTLFALAACMLAAVVTLFDLAHTPQLKIQEAWFGIRGARNPSPQVAIVGIDGKALNAVDDRWPWDRETYVPLIDKLSAAGAKVIGFDIAFSKVTDQDADFAEAMRRAGNVAFGMVFNDAGDPSPPSMAAPPEVVQQAVPAFHAPFLELVPAPGVEPPSPPLAEAAAAIGHVVMLNSTDGTLRRVPTLVRHGDRSYPSFAVQVARVYADVPLEEIRVTDTHVQIGYADIPITQTGEVSVNWPTTDIRNAYPTYSVVDVLRGDVGERELQGKAVLVGMTAEGLDDREFPFNTSQPGVFLHATFLDNFFTLSFLESPSWGIGLELGLFLVLAVLSVLLFPRLGTPALLVAAPVLVLGVLGVSLYFFVTHSLWWPPLYPSLAVAFPFFTTVVFKLRSTEKAKEFEEAKVKQAEEKLVEAELEKGLAFQEKGSLDLAIATFNKLPMTDDMKDIYLSLGFDFQSRGNLEKAFLCYKKVYDLDPTYGQVANRLEALRQSGIGTQLVAGQTVSPVMAPATAHQLEVPPPEAPQSSEPTRGPTGASVISDVFGDQAGPGTLVEEPEIATLRMEEETTSAPVPTAVHGTATTGPGTMGGIEPQPGSPGSRYRLVQNLGKGAMGEVFLMDDLKLDRKVAIKTIRPDVEMSSREAIEMRQRFVREAQTAGKLTHPNIVTVYDSFEGEGGVAFIVMEYVEGDTLTNISKKGRFNAAQIKHVIVNAASGLHHAHEHGVFHRDVKPDNIMIAPKTGVVKLMDFGIARLVESSMTATGSVLGTPGYMAPEQVHGRKVDARSDVFSLGVVLFELLVGHRPFTGKSVSELFFAIIQQETPRPSTAVPERGVSPEWDAVVIKALEKKPDARYQTAQEFANAVRAVRAK